MNELPPAYKKAQEMARGGGWGTFVIVFLVAVGVLVALIAVAPSEPRVVGVEGSAVYAQSCATCHGPDGSGVNRAFPPLNGSAWVNIPEPYLARLVLRGLRGPIVVHGETYNNVMPPHSFLTDDQVAAVLTFVKQEFGSGGTVTAELVARERAAHGEGPMWTIDELMASPPAAE